MNQPLTRKEFISNSAKLAAGAAVGIGVVNALAPQKSHAHSVLTSWPWPYQTLDTEKVRKYGHDAYWIGKGCSYGAFHALIRALREVLPDPYDNMPSELMIYGHGGTVGWGTLCGALNGGAGIISLVCQKDRSDILVHELLGWYTDTLFPTATSNQYAVDQAYEDNRYNQTLPQNKSGSPLCHTSVTEWCVASSFEVASLERKERCARLTGDVAAYTAKILNDELAGTFTPTYTQPTETTTCLACHSGTGVKKNVAAKMNCTQCHGDPHTLGVVELVGGAGMTYELSQNYPNPFNPNTNISFAIPKQETVNLSIFDVHGREVRTLVSSQSYSPGTYKVDWDGKDNSGHRVASGIYFSRMQAGDFVATKKLSFMK